MKNIIYSLALVFSLVILTSLTDDPPKIPPTLPLESPNDPYFWVRFDTTATDTTHRMFVYMGEYGWIALADSTEVWNKFVPYRGAKDSLITNWPIISPKFIGDTAQINDVFIWRNDTILKDSLAYFDVKPDSVRLRYINGSWSKWYLSSDKIKEIIGDSLAIIFSDTAKWNAAYRDKINSLAFTGTTTKTLTLTQQDGGTVTGNFTDLVDDADADPTNELQDLSISNDTLLLSNSTAKVSLKPYLTTLGTANGLSLSNQQLSLGLASSSTTGALSSTDWDNFNSKQNALTNPITGTGTSGQVSFWNDTSTQTGDNGLYWDNVNKRLGIGTTDTSAPLTVAKTITVFTDIPMQKWDPLTTNYGLTLSNYNSVFGVDYRFTQLNAGTTYPVLTFQDGNVGIGTNSPTSKLDVNGTTTSSILKMTTGAAAGRLVVSDAAGTMSWKSLADAGVQAVLTSGTTIKTVFGNSLLGSGDAGTAPIAYGGTGLTTLGTANQLLRVNSGATALEYFTPNWIDADLIDTTGISNGNLLKYNSTSEKFEVWVPNYEIDSVTYVAKYLKIYENGAEEPDSVLIDTDVQDNAVSYNKLASDLKRSSVVTNSVDFSADAIGTISLTANTTFSFSNLQINKVYTLIIDTNGYEASFPAYCSATTGSFEILGDFIYYLDLRCFNSSSGSEEVLYTVFHRKNP